MLDKEDIQNLIKAQKEVFVTKEEFEGLIDIVVTKEDAKSFATKDDLKEELKKTKKEFLGEIIKRFDSVDEKLKVVNKLETRMDYIENVLAIKKS